MSVPFFHHPDTLRYDFGPKHPLKPERLRRTLELLQRVGNLEPTHPGLAGIDDLLRVHSPEYVEAVRQIDVALDEGSEQSESVVELRRRHGFFGDNPPFPGMFHASLAYVGAVVRAAETVRDGAPLALAIDGGLHHALRDRASGFCLFNDPAIALSILRERFERVAYVDIDVHHGDGVQWLWYDDPSVLTLSIHEEGRTLFPRTGDVEETGADYTSFNVPLAAKTTADVWLDAFERTLPLALERFAPGAIVLQLGTDTHHLDPLGHILSGQAAWLTAVERVRDLGLPIVAIGGGGYNLKTVPRMWTSACLTLARIPYEDALPIDLSEAWGFSRFRDDPLPFASGGGREHATAVVDRLTREHLLRIPKG